MRLNVADIYCSASRDVKKINLRSVRLCVQAFLHYDSHQCSRVPLKNVPLAPIVSNEIVNKSK